MNKQCKFCIHNDVCAYKKHYEDAVELYDKTKNECGNYPYFICDIRCIKYLKEGKSQESEAKEVIGRLIATLVDAGIVEREKAVWILEPLKDNAESEDKEWTM